MSASAAAAFSDFPLSRRGISHQLGPPLGTRRGQVVAQLAYFRTPRLAQLRSSRRLSSIGIKMDQAWYHERFSRTFGSPGITMLRRQQMEVSGEQLSSQLRWADLTSMAFSVEDRMPFLDHNLVDLALSTPTELLFKDGWSKWPLRRLLSDTMPESIAWRTWKIGFEAPRTSFDPHDSESRRLIRDSEVLRELGVQTSTLDDAARPILWRLFAIALWEQEVLTAGLNR